MNSNNSIAVREAIILAGGLGTRLKDAVPGIPKCMAPVAGRPFLFYVINYLRRQGIHHMIFSLGHMHGHIENYLTEKFPTLSYTCVVENEALGTGGAIKLACKASRADQVVIVNGDSFFNADLQSAFHYHRGKDAECTLILKPQKDFNRYGVVETDDSGRVMRFREKQFYESGLINGGIYLLDVNRFMATGFPEKFSFEKDYLEPYCGNRAIFGYVQDAYFIDIGVPEDYQRAQSEFSTPPPDLGKIDRSWTLFIDRDGVINHEKKDDYVRNTGEFRFYDGVKEAFDQFGKKFGKIIVVSNQRGVGRGLMTIEELEKIHQLMKEEIQRSGGRIDRIYYCTSTDNLHPERKPNPGMAYRAAEEFNDIDLGRSMIAGNKLSDMQFGRNAGMYTVFIATTNPETAFPHPDIDMRFPSLADFAKAL